MSKFLKFLGTWKLHLIAGVAVIAALAAIIFAAYHSGYSKGSNISTQVIAQYESRIHDLQGKVVTKIVKGDDRIVTKYIETVRYQDRIIYQNRDIIKTVVVNRPETLAKGWVYAHNQSALMQAIDPSLASDATPSGIQDNVALEKIADNYGKANACIAQLESLQAVVKERERILAETAKN